MEWYISNSIYFLSVPQLLQDPRPQQQRRNRTPSNTATTSNPLAEEHHQQFSAPPQYESPQATGHSFGSSSQDMFSNLFGVDFTTPSSAHAYMDSLYQQNYAHEVGSSSSAFQDVGLYHQQDPSQHQAEVHPQDQPEQPQRPRRNRLRPRCGTGHHYGD